MTAATATTGYAVNCAGCGARLVFASVEALAEWTRGHKCWKVRANG